MYIYYNKHKQIEKYKNITKSKCANNIVKKTTNTTWMWH